MNDNNPPALPAAATAALQMGRKLEAIKIVREERKLGLKEAKDLVEAYLAEHPSLQGSMRTEASGGLAWAVILLLVVVAIGYFLTRT